MFKRSVALLILMLLLVACGSQAGAPAGLADRDLAAVPQEETAGQPNAFDDAAGGVTTTDGPTLVEQAARQVVRTGSVTVEVEDLAAAVEVLREIAAQADGYIGASNIDEQYGSGSLTLRVPVDSFDVTISALRGLGEVQHIESNESDVTTVLVDMEARLANLRAAEENYRALLDRGEAIEDLLAVQTRLDQVRGEIESLDAQRLALQGQADLATLTVLLHEPESPVSTQSEDYDPGDVAGRALADLLALGQGVLSAVIYLVILGLPLLILLGVLALPVWLIWRQHRKSQRPVSPGE